jgi:hypothetical protein
MIYIYRRRNSVGARDLAEGITLAGQLARRTKGLALRNLVGTDAVVCWGDNFAAPAGVKTLNNVAPLSKFAEAQKLAAEGVETVQVSRTRPAAAAARPAIRGAFPLTAFRGLETLTEAQATQLQRQINAYLTAPLPPAQPAETWLARKNNHIGGNDLLADNLAEVDFYSKKENIVEEYRLHIFRGKSIRAGKKVARATRPDGRTPAHQWIRSFDAGWVIQYDAFTSTKEMRALAIKAVKALGLDFAAVDLGKRADGSLIVLEVNRAPGVEGNSISAYSKHIIAWANGQERDEE